MSKRLRTGKYTWRGRFKSRKRGYRAMSRRVPVSYRRRWNRRTAGLLGIEKKYFDYDSGEITSANAHTLMDAAGTPVFCPQQGASSIQRDGRRCIIKSIYAHILAYQDQKTDQDDFPAADPQCTISLVWDRQTNAALMTGANCFTGTLKSQPFRNMQYTYRFKVLWSKHFTIHYDAAFTDGANTGTLNGRSVYKKLFKKINIPVTFVASTGNLADIIDNSLHWVISADSADIKARISSRVRFVG